IGEVSVGVVENRNGVESSRFGGLAAAFEYMRLVWSKHKDVIRSERMHRVFGNQCAFPFDKPNQLCLFMPMHVRIALRQSIFLYNDCLIGCHWNGKLKCPHNGVIIETDPDLSGARVKTLNKCTDINLIFPTV